MCGIVGTLGQRGPREVRDADTRAMAQVIAHRGPDGEGCYLPADEPVTLAQRRLAVIDLTAGGAQPIHDPTGRYVLVYNGETYNYRELRADLERQGWRFRSTSDTEVVLTAIIAWGMTRALQRMDAMFALALWDRAEAQLTLARDRFGEKPLTVANLSGGGLCFASELHAIRRHTSFDARLSPAAKAAFLRYKVVPGTLSIHADARKIEPGTYEEFRADDTYDSPTRRVVWYSALDAACEAALRPFEGDGPEAVEEADRLLRRSVARRIVADVPLGAFLSGGIDSRVVTALLADASSAPPKTFTIGTSDPDYDERDLARRSAAALGAEHCELRVEASDALPALESLAGTADEPFGDSSLLPTRIVSELARSQVTVALSGDGGDEVFGGYERYRWIPRVQRLGDHVPNLLRRAAVVGLDAVPPRAWSIASRGSGGSPRVRRLGQKADKAIRALASSDAVHNEWRVLEHWSDAESLVVGAPESPPFTGWRSVPAVADPGTRMAARDLVGYLPDDILTKVDRAAMSVSLETRVPILDPDVVAFGFSLPAELRWRDGRSKWVLREVLARYLPRDLIDAPKAGFGLPIDAWLRSELRGWAESLLSVPALERAGLHPTPIRAVWAQHCSNATDAGSELWTVLSLVSWMETV